MITIVTGWSPQGWRDYAHRFVESIPLFPSEVRFIAYVEEIVPDIELDIEQRLIWDIPGCKDFLDRHRGTRANGGAPSQGWKDKEVAAGYSYRFDALKFCKQGFIPYHAAQGLEGIMVWLDADVAAFKEVPAGLFRDLTVGSVNYLGRGNHSEIGFVSYRLPDALPMLREFYQYYNADTVFELKEWHSAYVFDRAREKSGILGHNITPGGRGHVWFQSPLGGYLDHMKGNRKKRGYSKEAGRAARLHRLG